MPGFGSGPFGAAAFGEFDWSRRVLFDFIPELHRDADVDGLLEAYAEALGLSYDQLRRKIRDFGDLRDPLKVRTQYDEVLPIRLGARIELLGPVEQRGVEASVDAIQTFVTQRGRFTEADEGKQITVTGSTIPSNNITVRLARVVSPKLVVTDPPLTTDAGPLNWTIRIPDQTPEGEVVVEVQSGNLDLVAPGWKLGDGLTEVDVLARTQFKPEIDEQAVLTDQEGADGQFVSGNFVSAVGGFIQSHVGRRFTTTGSQFPDNNSKWEVSAVLGPNTITLTGPTTPVADDLGPLTWALLRIPQLVVQGPSVPKGLVEQSAEDGITGAVNVFTALSGRFTADDIGKILTARKAGSAINDLVYEVIVVTSLQTIEVTPNLPAVETDVFWELRSKTSLGGDGTDLQVRATSLIRRLATDFAIPIDTREDEEFQRRWVASVSRWTGIKGLADAYKFLGALTGYDVSACDALYRVGLEVFDSLILLPAAETYVVLESTVGRFGVDGSLTLSGGRMRFSSPTAAFLPTDVDRHIEIQNSDFLGTIAIGDDGGFVEITVVWSPGFVSSDVGKTIEVIAAADGSYNVTHTITAFTSASVVVTDITFAATDSGEATLFGQNQGVVGTIESVISGTEVEFRFVDTSLLLPDGDNPSLPWAIVRLYTNVSPERPLMDEINTDRMTELKGAAAFQPDMYCFETGWSTTLGPGSSADGAIFIDSADPPVAAAIPIAYAVVGRGDFEVVVSIGEGRWKLTDSGATTHFLETAPQLRPVTLFTDRATIGPPILNGAGFFRITTPDSAFAIGDVGKLIRFRNATAFTPDNFVTISDFVDANTIEVDDTASGFLAAGTVDDGSLEVSEVFTGTTALGPPRVTGTSGTFSAADVHRRLDVFISESAPAVPAPENLGLNNVDAVPVATTIEFDTAVTSIASAAATVVFEVQQWEFVMIATQPPATGDATLAYVCPTVLDCDFCASSKVRVEATTTLALEKGAERLASRLAEVTPKHVEIVTSTGVTATATGLFTATVTTP